ncbi:uncharacterized protein LOC108681740 [Hyalella azteca]|uniref:Uncharacterized protein LOC108681740 n=1 Tax=Hyalella azteca TaxID=294128 RepID=A0A8B7PJE5_HYAAZ|nr:uncharacterized protein LOC108681740 [Hyalella azteca]
MASKQGAKFPRRQLMSTIAKKSTRLWFSFFFTLIIWDSFSDLHWAIDRIYHRTERKFYFRIHDQMTRKNYLKTDLNLIHSQETFDRKNFTNDIIWPVHNRFTFCVKNILPSSRHLESANNEQLELVSKVEQDPKYNSACNCMRSVLFLDARNDNKQPLSLRNVSKHRKPLVTQDADENEQRPLSSIEYSIEGDVPCIADGSLCMTIVDRRESGKGINNNQRATKSDMIDVGCNTEAGWLFMDGIEVTAFQVKNNELVSFLICLPSSHDEKVKLVRRKKQAVQQHRESSKLTEKLRKIPKLSRTQTLRKNRCAKQFIKKFAMSTLSLSYKQALISCCSSVKNFRKYSSQYLQQISLKLTNLCRFNLLLEECSINDYSHSFTGMRRSGQFNTAPTEQLRTECIFEKVAVAVDLYLSNKISTDEFTHSCEKNIQEIVSLHPCSRDLSANVLELEESELRDSSRNCEVGISQSGHSLKKDRRTTTLFAAAQNIFTTEPHIFTGLTQPPEPPTPALPEFFIMEKEECARTFCLFLISYLKTYNFSRMTLEYRDGEFANLTISLKLNITSGVLGPNYYQPTDRRRGFVYRLGGLSGRQRYFICVRGHPATGATHGVARACLSFLTSDSDGETDAFNLTGIFLVLGISTIIMTVVMLCVGYEKLIDRKKSDCVDILLCRYKRKKNVKRTARGTISPEPLVVPHNNVRTIPQAYQNENASFSSNEDRRY